MNYNKSKFVKNFSWVKNGNKILLLIVKLFPKTNITASETKKNKKKK